MGGGGKGGSQTSQVQIPKWIEEPATRNLARAEEAAKIGYMPYYGPDIAAFTPMQEAAFGATGQAAEAFGLAPRGTLSGSASIRGMPASQTYAGGIRGYSSGGLYDQAVAELAARRPGQYQRFTEMFVDPMTGLTAAEVEAEAKAAEQGTGEDLTGFDYVPVQSNEDDWMAESQRITAIRNAGIPESELRKVNIGGVQYYAVPRG